jgi:DNA-binding transcriptional MerR regulator
MAWSTRELADLAGTTLKAVRHYHKLGLLEEPDRNANGYKQYQVAHLVRLLQITRLANLGVPLAQIAAMRRADENPTAALRTLDAELEATVDRLQRIRGELASILENGAPAEMPPGFGSVAGALSESDRSMIMIYSRVFDAPAMEDMQQIVADELGSTTDAEFDALPADADRATRNRLARELAPVITGLAETYPWLNDPGSRAPRGNAFAEGTVVQALRELYNPAQLEVLYRAHLINNGTAEDLTALDAAIDAGTTAAATGSAPTDERTSR